MNALLTCLTLTVFAGVLFLMPAVGPAALAVCAVVSLPAIILLVRGGEERTFLLRLFVIGLLLRVIVASIINLGNMQEFFGGDANTYDVFGKSLAASWHGDYYHGLMYQRFVRSGAGVWGMLYLVAGVVGTTEGALTAIPLGIVYLLFAPFPWQLASIRQSIALPEMIIWWLAFPLLILGSWYAIRHRLRSVSPFCCLQQCSRWLIRCSRETLELLIASARNCWCSILSL